MKNLGEMMKQVQEMQGKMQEMQARLEEATVTGTSGGGLVTVELNGKGAMKSVSIDPSLLVADEKEIVEDLILAAHGDARIKVDKMMAEQMNEVTGGMPLPPGFQMPG
ncbi:Nucleoid-associated protein YaaK [hydrothermal vent metagenome]|uniref:Nucleoid-associated protein YaaK n=1 Tax=hydrothermal vent metagenome TaxID=652676 RepID=A0A3B0RVF4_9ZZZZ